MSRMSEDAGKEKILFFHQVTKERIQQAREATGRLAYLISLMVAATFVGGGGTLIALMVPPVFAWDVLAWGIFGAIAAGFLFLIAHFWDRGVIQTTDRYPERGHAICVTSQRILVIRDDFVMAESALRESREKTFEFPLVDFGGMKLKQDFWDRHSNTYYLEIQQAPFGSRQNAAISYTFLDRDPGYRIVSVIWRAWANLSPQVKSMKEARPKLVILTKNGTWAIKDSWELPDTPTLETLLQKFHAITAEMQMPEMDTKEVDDLIPGLTVAGQDQRDDNGQLKQKSQDLFGNEIETDQKKMLRMLKAEEGKEAHLPVSESMVQQACGGEPILWKGGPHQYLVKKTMQLETLGFLIFVSLGIWGFQNILLQNVWIGIFIWFMFSPLFIGFTLFGLLTEFTHKHDYYVLTPSRLLVFRQKQWHDFPLGQLVRAFAHIGTWSGPTLSNYYTEGATGTIYLSTKCRGMCEELLFNINPLKQVWNLLCQQIGAQMNMGKETP